MRAALSVRLRFAFALAVISVFTPRTSGAKPHELDTASLESASQRATGDEAFGPEVTSGVSFRLLFQTRYTHTAPEISAGLREYLLREASDPSALPVLENQVRTNARAGDGLDLERVFLRATAQPVSWVGLKLLVDFAELAHKNQKRALKLAYGELKPTRGVTITAGLFKIPFSLLELLPIADFELADSGPTDDLVKDLGIAGRDLGVAVELAPFAKHSAFTATAGVFAGSNVDASRHAGPGMLALRLTARPTSHLRLGADCAYRPFDVDNVEDGTVTPKYVSGGACSADATFSYKRLQLRAEWLTGRRTDVIGSTTRNFMAAWAVLAYRYKLRGHASLTPALRAEWLDEDRSQPIATTTTLSAAMNVDFSASARLLFDLSRSYVQLGTVDRSSELRVQKPSLTRGVIQLQLKL